MQNFNGWLVALAFVLGLVLTLALLIRRVKREVPEYATLAAGAGAAAAGAPGVAGAAKLKGGHAGVVEEDPYGAGSIRVKATATAPDGGYTVKGNEDSMLYHTTDSPSYKQTIAEVWFRDAKSAERAGFLRWDSGRSGADADDDAATLKAPKIDVDADDSAAKPGVVAAGAAATGAAVAGGAAAAKFADTSSEKTAKIAAVTEEPYGPGSARVAAGAAAPWGYDIKGNEDSMLYHTTDSPSYKRTIAEVWFRDEQTAEAAGFSRWDSGKSQREER
jgi:uncharacterized membrane protein ArfC